MGFGVELCFLCLLLSLPMFCSARNTISLADSDEISIQTQWGDEIVLDVEGRSLKASIQDYDEPKANRGHDPPSRTRGGGGGRGRNG